MFSFIIIIILFLKMVNFSKKIRGMSFAFYLIFLSIILSSFYIKIDTAVGADWHLYRMGFESNISITNLSDEVALDYLNIFIRTFTKKYFIAFSIYMFIINFFVLKGIYNYSKNIEFSIIIYICISIFTIALNITRQCFAVSIFFFSTIFLFEKKYFYFIIFFFIMFQFHQSIVVPALIILFVIKFNDYIYNRYFSFIILLQSLFLIEPIIQKIGVSLFYEDYLNNSFTYGSNILHYIVQISICLFYYLNKKYIYNRTQKIMIIFSSFGTLFTLLGLKMVLYNRIALYFTIFHIVNITNILNNYPFKFRRLISYILLILFIGYLFLVNLKNIAHMDNYFFDLLFVIKLVLIHTV